MRVAAKALTLIGQANGTGVTRARAGKPQARICSLAARQAPAFLNPIGQASASPWRCLGRHSWLSGPGFLRAGKSGRSGSVKGTAGAAIGRISLMRIRARSGDRPDRTGRRETFLPRPGEMRRGGTAGLQRAACAGPRCGAGTAGLGAGIKATAALWPRARLSRANSADRSSAYARADSHCESAYLRSGGFAAVSPVSGRFAFLT